MAKAKAAKQDKASLSYEPAVAFDRGGELSLQDRAYIRRRVAQLEAAAMFGLALRLSRALDADPSTGRPSN